MFDPELFVQLSLTFISKFSITFQRTITCTDSLLTIPVFQFSKQHSNSYDIELLILVSQWALRWSLCIGQIKLYISFSTLNFSAYLGYADKFILVWTMVLC